MKKTFLIIICLLLACTVCACGARPEAAPAPSATEAPTAPAETAAPATPEPVQTSEPTPEPTEEPEPQLVEYGEPVIYQWVEFNEDEPSFEIVVPVKNISDVLVGWRGSTFTLTDKDGSEVGVFQGADAAPMYLEPGDEGVIYYIAINRSGLDYLNPDYTLDFTAEPADASGWGIVPLEVTDVSLTRNLGDWEIHGNLVNSTDEEFKNPYVSFLFLDKEGNPLCGAFGYGGVGDYTAPDFGALHANTTCPFTTYRYWFPNDYPLENVTVISRGYGLPY